ncbi:hypothetical protein BGX34_002551 [Mortierella sp. NVP85]|nr:hypothetical protein BGX34_002551 [Mortierella sp. NVP85]
MFGWNNIPQITTHDTPGCSITVIWPAQPRPPPVPAAPPPPPVHHPPHHYPSNHYPPYYHAPYHYLPNHYPHGPPPPPVHYPPYYHAPKPVPASVPLPGYDIDDEKPAIQLSLESFKKEKAYTPFQEAKVPAAISAPLPGYDIDDEKLAIQLSLESFKKEKAYTPFREAKVPAAIRDPLPGYDIESDEKLAIQLSLESFKKEKAYTPVREAKVPAAIRHQPILHHQPSGNLTSSHDRYGSASSNRRARRFEESTDKMPQLFLVAPALEEPVIDGTYRPFRILTPCQAPSILEGDEDSIHLTHHEGYTIKNPRDLVHKCRNFIRSLDAISAYLFIGAAAVGVAHGFSIDPTDLHRPLNGSSRMAQNRTHLRRVGIQTREFYKKQWVVDNHQIEAMIKLFQSAGFADRNGNMRFNLRPIHFGGPTKWVCEECYQLLTRDRTIPVDHLMTLDEYRDLTKRATEVDVVLRCSASVITFTRMLKKYVQVRKAVIRIESGYFQTAERQFGTQFEAIQNQFIELAKALKPQPLTSLEIHGDNECGSVFMGLERVLKCADLEILQVTGMPHFLEGLEGRDLIQSTYKLRQLELDGVHIHTQKAAENLIKLLRANTALKAFGLSRSRLTLDAISVLNSDDRVKKRFGELSQLNLSNNDFGAATARSLVAMALKGSCLQRLDLSNSRGIGDAGCREILELLQVKGRRLDTIVTDGTGISNDTARRMDKFRHHRH